MLRQLAVAACLTLPFAAFAAEAKNEMTPQQQKMADCNKQAGDKKLAGDERKKFMSTCLSADGAAKTAKPTTQQEKMTACNKQAGEKKLAGDERKKFMSACLSG